MALTATTLAAAIKVCDETAQTYPATSAETELSEAQVCAAAIRAMMDSGRPAAKEMP